LLAAAPVPVPDTDGQHATVVWYNGIMLLNRNDRARAGFNAFVEYLYKPANMAKLLTVAPGFFLPVTEEAAQAKELLGNPTVSRHLAAYKVEIQQSRVGRELGFTREPYNHKVGRITGQNLLAWTAQQMIHQGLSPAAAVKLGQQQMMDALH
jgi:ABC-type glycerol-3-phosphate transport system substrate-binding protein